MERGIAVKVRGSRARPGGHEHIHGPVVGCQVKGRSPAVVPGVGSGAPSGQEPRHLGPAEHGGEVQRGHLQSRSRVGVGAAIEEQSGDLGLADQGRYVEGRVSVLVKQIDGQAAGQQTARSRDIASAYRLMEGRHALLTAVDVGCGSQRRPL
jgi:hypothetical protein